MQKISATCTCCQDKRSNETCQINNASICWCKQFNKVLKKTRRFLIWPPPWSFRILKKQVFAFQSKAKKRGFWLSHGLCGSKIPYQDMSHKCRSLQKHINCVKIIYNHGYQVRCTSMYKYVLVHLLYRYNVRERNTTTE